MYKKEGTMEILITPDQGLEPKATKTTDAIGEGTMRAALGGSFTLDGTHTPARYAQVAEAPLMPA